MKQRISQSRPGAVLIAVLVVVVLSVLFGASIVWSANAEIDATRHANRATQSRALAWSGVQAAMAELAAQRDDILRAGRPRLSPELDAFSKSGGVVRLVEITAGATAVPEASKLNVNVADRSAVEAIVGPALAEAIMSAVAAQPLGSIGEIVEPSTSSGAGAAAAPSAAPSPPASTAAAAPEPPADPLSLLTTISFDPSVQSGAGTDGDARTAQARYRLSDWNPETQRAVIAALGAEASASLKKAVDAGEKAATRAELVALAQRAGLPSSTWGGVLDLFTTWPEDFAIGLIDVNTAPAKVLSTIPGIDPQTAERILQGRERLTVEARRHTAWLVSEGILSAEQYLACVDRLTSRCMQWRVRVEAGFERAGDGSASAGDAAELSDVTILEAVIDISGPTPRVAYLRDATFLGAARALLSAGPIAAPEPVTEPETEEVPERAPPEPPLALPEAAPEPAFSGEEPPPVDSEVGEPAGGDPRLGRWTTGKRRSP